jgi:hypothetical protein
VPDTSLSSTRSATIARSSSWVAGARADPPPHPRAPGRPADHDDAAQPALQQRRDRRVDRRFVGGAAAHAAVGGDVRLDDGARIAGERLTARRARARDHEPGGERGLDRVELRRRDPRLLAVGQPGVDERGERDRAGGVAAIAELGEQLVDRDVRCHMS